MYSPRSTENEMLKAVLVPLLEDFHYWFTRALSLLESERLTFLTVEEQERMVGRLKLSLSELAAVRSLYKATGGQAGIESRVLLPWHRLVADCWRVSSQWRALQQDEGDRSPGAET